MPKEVDTKVIQMEFDNADFEKGVKQTQESIKGLKSSITDLSDSANGSESINKVNEVVVAKMNVLATAVDQTVRRITDNVLNSINSVTRKFDELTLAPISQGFGKYEEQISSVQTIMNATGKSIEDVQKQLDKLMWYTDETSYSYSDMASNIGKFTSAGVELDDAVTAMMGIANWAGISGANVQQASRAMYNLSQAMGTGTLKLQDWMSIENANMATREFKDNLIETAKELGVLAKDTEITAENMRESLKDGWVTADVLTATLKKYGNYTEDLYKIQGASGGAIDGATDAMEAYNEIYAKLAEDLTNTYNKFGKNSEEFQKLIKDNNISMETANDLIAAQSVRIFNENLEKTYEKLKVVADKYGIESENFRKEAEKTGYAVKDAAKMVEEGIDSFTKIDQSLGEKALRASQEAKTFTDAWQATIDGVSSAWLRFWQAIWGNYEEAKELWTWLANEPLYETFSATASEIAEVVEKASYLGLHTNIVEGFELAWEHVRNAIEAVKEVFGEVFPFFANLNNASITIYGISERFKMWAQALAFTNENLQMNEEGIAQYTEKIDAFKDSVRNTMVILKSLAIIVGNIVWNIGRIITELLPNKDTIRDFITNLLGDVSQVDQAVSGITNKITFVANVIIAIIRFLKYAIVNAVTSILPAVISGFMALVGGIINFFTSDFFSAIVSVASTVGRAIFAIALTIIGTLSFLFKAIYNLVIAIIGVIQQFAEAEDKLELLKTWFVNLVKALEPLRIIFDSILTTFDVIIRVCGHVVNAVAEFVSNIDIWRAALILLVVHMINAGLGIGWLISKILGGFKAIWDVLTTAVNPIKWIITKFLSGIQEAVEGLLSIVDVAKLEAIGHVMLTYAVSMIMISGAAIMLSTIDPTVFKQALYGVLTLMAILAAFMVACNKILNSKTIKSFKEILGPDGKIKETIESVTQTLSMGAQLLSISAVVASLAALMTVLGDVYNAVGTTTAFFTIIAGVGVLLAGIFFAILMFQKSMAKVNEKTDNTVSIKIDAVTGSITHVALGIAAIAGSMLLLSFINPDQMDKATSVLVLFAAILMGCALAISHIAKSLAKYDKTETTKTIDYIDSFAEALGGLAKAIRNMAIGLFIIGKIPAERLWPSVGAVAALTIALVGIMTVFTILVERLTETYKKKTSKAINGFKSEFSWALLGSKSGNIEKEGVGGNDMLKVAFAIQILCNSMMGIALAVVPLSFFEYDKIMAATISLITLMSLVAIILGLFTESIKNQDKNKREISSKDILKLSASISLTAFAIDLLTAAILPLAGLIMASRMLMGENDISPVGRAVGAIAEIIAALAGYNASLILALALYNKNVPVMLEDGTIKEIASGLVKMAAAIDLIAIAIAGLATLRWATGDNLTPAVGAITIVIGAMTVFLDAVLAAVALVGNKSHIDPEGIIKQLGFLVIFIATAIDMMSVAIAALTALALIPGTDLKTASNAITSLTAVVGFVEALIVAATTGAKWDTSDMLTATGKAFILMAAGIDIMSLGIIGIMVAIGKMHIPTDAVTAVMRGIEIIFFEIGLYLTLMISHAEKFPKLTTSLYGIALATDLMAAAIGIIALSLSVLLSYGEDTFAGIGIFAVLISLIGVYNAVMMELSKAVPDKGMDTLIAIAVDFLMMSAAIAIIAPAVASLAELQKQLGDATITAAVFQGIIEPLIAIIAGVAVLMALSKTLGGEGKWGDILALSAVIISLSGGMLLLANAARVLASIDMEALKNVANIIEGLMWTFTQVVAVIAVVSNVAGDKVKELSLAFLAFVAALVIAIWALNSVRKAMREMAEDPVLMDAFSKFGEWIKEEPIQAALTTAGIIAGSTLALAMIDRIKKALADGFDDIFKDLGHKISSKIFVDLPKSLGANIIAGGGGLTGTAAYKLFGNTTLTTAGNLVLDDGLLFGLGKGLELTPMMAGWATIGTVLGAVFATKFAAESALGLIDFFRHGEDPSYLTPIQQTAYGWGQAAGKYFNEAFNNTVDIIDENGIGGTAYGVDGPKNNALTFNTMLEYDLKLGNIDFDNNSKKEREKAIKDIEKMSKAVSQYYFEFGKLPDLSKVEGLAGYSSRLLQDTTSYQGQIFAEVIKAYQGYYGGARTLEQVQAKQAEKEAEQSAENIARFRKLIEDELRIIAKQQNGRILTYQELWNQFDYKKIQVGEGTTTEFEEAYKQAAYNIRSELASVAAEETRVSQEQYNNRMTQLRNEYEEKRLYQSALNDENSKSYINQMQYEDAVSAKREAAHEKERLARERITKNTVTMDEYLTHIANKEAGTVGSLKTQGELKEDIEETTQGIVSTEEAVGLAIAEENRLYGKQFNLVKAINDIRAGDWSGVSNAMNQLSSKDGILERISGYFTKWGNSAISSIATTFGIDEKRARNAFNLITGGFSFDTIWPQLTGYLGTGVLDDIKTKAYDLFGGGQINLRELENFDLSDFEGSIRRIFPNLDTEKGFSFFKDIFDVKGEDFNLSTFTNLFLDDAQWKEMTEVLSGYAGESLDYSKAIDWDKVANAADLAGYDAGNVFGQSYTDGIENSVNYNDILTPTAEETQNLVDGFAEAGDLAAEAFRNAIQEQEDALKETATAMGNAYATAFNAAEEATANPSLAQQNAEAINAQVESFEENKLYAAAYKRQLDKDEANLKAAEENLKKAEKAAEKKKYNADGSEDTSAQKALEAAKKQRDEAKAQYDATKSQYDAYISQMKTAKEGYLDSREKSDFQKNPEKLSNAIAEANRERELLREALETGDFSKLPDSIKNVNDLVDALKDTEERIAELETIEQEVIAEDKADGEISGDIAPKYSEFSQKRIKASREEIRDENAKLKEELDSNLNKIAYLQSKDDAWSKQQVEQYKKRNEEIRRQINANAQQSNDLVYDYVDKETGERTGYKDLVNKRERTQYEIDAIEKALSEFDANGGKIVLPASVMAKYKGTENWAELLETLYADLATYDARIKAVANVGLENAEDRPEEPDYISLAEQVSNLTTNFEDLFIASKLFEEALKQARGSVGSRMEELNAEYALNRGLLKGLEGKTDEKSLQRKKELEARQTSIEEEQKGLSEAYNMMSPEDREKLRQSSKDLEKTIEDYKAIISIDDEEEFKKKSNGRSRQDMANLYYEAMEQKAQTDAQLGMLNDVFEKNGDISTDEVNTDFGNLSTSTKELTTSFDNLKTTINPDTGLAADAFGNVPKTAEGQQDWVNQDTGYTPVDTSAYMKNSEDTVNKAVAEAQKQTDDTVTKALDAQTTTLANSALNASRDVEFTKLSKLPSESLLEVTNAKLDELFSKLNDIYTNGAELQASMSAIESGVEGMAGSGIYLDGRTLIGRIAPDIDKALGGFAFRRGTV